MSFSREELERLRAETPGCANRIHLNNAGAGLMPLPVVEAIQTHIDLESKIGGYEAGDAKAQEIASAYAAVGTLLNCPARNVAMVENATVAYQQALSSIPFERGDVILTTHNDYISNQIMFLSLAKRLEVEVVRAPESSDGGVCVEGLERLVRERRPILVAVTHVPTGSGLVQPVEAVGRICRAVGAWYLVDACQSVGQLHLDVYAIGCDFLSSASRKFLRGPRGAGFLYVSDRALRASLEPLYPDMRGASWTAPDRYEAAESAHRFEKWELAYALVLGTGAAARYATGLGMERISQRTAQLAELTRQLLGRAGLRVLDRGAHKCGIVTVAIPGKDGDVLHDALEAKGVNSSVSRREYNVIDYAAKSVDWALRLSPHYYNTEEEIERGVAAVVQLAR